MTKYFSWILSVLLLLFSQTLLFPISVFAHSRCGMAFQQDIKPIQLKNRLMLIAQNKQKEIQNLDIELCGPNCLSFQSQAGLQFQVKKDSSLTEPEIKLSPPTKILRIPSYSWLHDSSSNNVIQRWLVGHEIHPYTSPSKIILHTEAQNTAFQAFKQALIEGVKSFLHIAPTSAGKTLVLAKALKEKLQNHRTNKISFVTAHQIRLVDQLFDIIQQELKGTDVTVINWNNRLNKDFYLEIERSVSRKHPTVFVITSQSLKQQLNFLQHKNLKVYSRLVESTDGIYIDEAHHLGAFHTKEALLILQKRSEAFLYGSTATPVHHEVNLRDFFEREHWSYLNTIEKGNLFASHLPEKVMEQLSLGIEKGEITPFDKLHIIGESQKFNITKEQPLFIQSENQFRVLNPHHYNTLTGILHPIIQPNKKGFIVTATIAEALRLTEFLNKAIEGITFEAYHSEMTRDQRKEVEKHSEQMKSHYIVAVRALDEGVNLPHLSAYIDLNVNISVKRMVHRIGRVLRLHPGKTEADILFLADYRNEEMARDLLQLLDVVNVLNFHSGIKYNRTTGDSSLRSSEVVPLTREELQELRKELEQFARNFWSNQKRERPSFDEAKEILKRKNITTGPQFKKAKETDPDLQHFPKTMESYKEWKGWPHFRGEIPRIKKGKKPSISEVEEIFRRKNIMSGPQFKKKRESDPELQNIPSNLEETYPEWKGWRHFRGETPPIKKSERPSFDEAKEILKRKNITTGPQFKKAKETDPDLQHFPKTMESYKEWKGWPHFRGEKPPVKEEERPPLNEAEETLRKKNIMYQTQYKEQRKTDPDLQHFPKTMESYKEWKGWKHFRGETPPIKKDEKPSYNELIEILERKNILTGPQLKKEKETDPELQNISGNINKIAYPEWKGWKHFREQMGIRKLSLEEIEETLRRKNITSGPQFKKERENDPELQNIPKKFYESYEGWKGWRHLQGKKPLVKKSERPSLEEIEETLRRKNITSSSQLKEQKKTDPELRVIPKDIGEVYKEWKGWPHFRGEKPLVKKDEKPPLNEVIKILKRKNILFETEWNIQKEIDPELQNIPRHIDKRTYPGWKGWRHLRGETPSTPRVKRGEKLPYNEVIKTLIRKNIFSGPEWETQRETDPELKHIPKALSVAYKEWKGWPHFREQIKEEMNK